MSQWLSAFSSSRATHRVHLCCEMIAALESGSDSTAFAIASVCLSRCARLSTSCLHLSYAWAHLQMCHTSASLDNVQALLRMASRLAARRFITAPPQYRSG